MLDRLQHPVQFFDAAGLGVFAVAGTQKALDYGINWPMAAILGMISGIGGGMARDVLTAQVPTVLREGLYAIPALLGAAVLVIAREAGETSPLWPLLGAMVCIVVRLVGIRFRFGLPTASAVAAGSPAGGRGSETAPPS